MIDMIHDSMRKMRKFLLSSLATSLPWIFYRQDMIHRSRWAFPTFRRQRQEKCDAERWHAGLQSLF